MSVDLPQFKIQGAPPLPPADQLKRATVKACVAWLHARAASMNDPHARQVLNGAALAMGEEFKRETCEAAANRRAPQ